MSSMCSPGVPCRVNTRGPRCPVRATRQRYPSGEHEIRQSGATPLADRDGTTRLWNPADDRCIVTEPVHHAASAVTPSDRFKGGRPYPLELDTAMAAEGCTRVGCGKLRLRFLKPALLTPRSRSRRTRGHVREPGEGRSACRGRPRSPSGRCRASAPRVLAPEIHAPSSASAALTASPLR